MDENEQVIQDAQTNQTGSMALAWAGLIIGAIFGGVQEGVGGAIGGAIGGFIFGSLFLRWLGCMIWLLPLIGLIWLASVIFGF